MRRSMPVREEGIQRQPRQRLSRSLAERGSKAFRDTEQSDCHLACCGNSCVASKPLRPVETIMRALCTRQGHRRDGWGSRVPELHLDLHALVTKQLHAHPSMVSATPVPPEDGLRTDGQWMQQHANLAGFRSGAAIPLTLLAQGAITTTANAGCIDHTQAAVAFSAPLMSTKLLIRRAAQRAIRLEGKILPREAARFPG